LIESFEKKKTKPVKKMKGRPISMDKVENDKTILSIWVVYSDIQPRFRMKLRAILADGLGVEDSYISKCIANMNKLIESGEVHICKFVDSKNRLRVFCLDKETVNLIQTSPEEAEKKLKSDWYHPVRWKLPSI
jgi:hypothetical protein